MNAISALFLETRNNLNIWRGLEHQREEGIPWYENFGIYFALRVQQGNLDVNASLRTSNTSISINQWCFFFQFARYHTKICEQNILVMNQGISIRQICRIRIMKNYYSSVLQTGENIKLKFNRVPCHTVSHFRWSKWYMPPWLLAWIFT